MTLSIIQSFQITQNMDIQIWNHPEISLKCCLSYLCVSGINHTLTRDTEEMDINWAKYSELYN